MPKLLLSQNGYGLGTGIGASWVEYGMGKHIGIAGSGVRVCGIGNLDGLMAPAMGVHGVGVGIGIGERALGRVTRDHMAWCRGHGWGHWRHRWGARVGRMG